MRLPVLVALIVMVLGLFLSGDSLATTTNISIPDDETTNSTNQTDSATLTITMITPPLPDE